MRRRNRFNVYGYWQFTDVLGLGHEFNKGDFAYVVSKCGDMVKALTIRGTLVRFHVTNLTKEYFDRIGKHYFDKVELKIYKKFQKVVSKYRNPIIHFSWQATSEFSACFSENIEMLKVTNRRDKVTCKNCLRTKRFRKIKR